MIKRALLLILLLGSLGSLVNAQSRQSVEDKLTFADLKPRMNYAQSEPFYQPLREKSGYALLSSAILPGSGQAANHKWLRAGLYFVAEAAFVGLHIKYIQQAKAEHRRYKEFANSNWSVVNYAHWLVQYHEQNNLSNPYIDQLRNQIDGKSPAYDPDRDWDKVDIKLLRKVERNTPFVYTDQRVGKEFSHVMPDYGSQQYYELISKYYQFGAGWNDFGTDRNGNPLDSRYQLPWDGSYMPFHFMRGADLAEKFNDSYHIAGNMLSLIILNHVVSAFDAFLTVKIRNNRLEAETNLLDPGRTFSLKFHF